jgi:hypothetical protein
MTTDFNTENLIIFQYPPGAGGKFLMSCIGLSKGAVLQHEHFAKRQLNSNLSTDQKYHFLMYELRRSESSGTWSDLGQGCRHLAGVTIDYYDKVSDSELNSEFSSVIELLSFSGLKFALVAHTPYVCKLGIKKWPKAKIVQLINHEIFYQKMRPNRLHSVDQGPLNFPNDIFEWDHSIIFDQKKFLAQMQSLYNWLDLSDFDAKLISNFYNRYMEVLEILKG